MTLLELLMCIAVALLLYITLCVGTLAGRLNQPAQRRGQDMLDRTPATPEQPPYGPVTVKDTND